MQQKSLYFDNCRQFTTLIKKKEEIEKTYFELIQKF